MRCGIATIFALGLAVYGCRNPRVGPDTSQTGTADPQKDRFALKQACMRAGLERAADDQKGLPQGTHVMNMEYCYSPKYNTCLYAGGFLSKDGQTLFVVDLATNRDVASAVIFSGEAQGESPADARQRRSRESAEYQKARDAAMATCIE